MKPTPASVPRCSLLLAAFSLPLAAQSLSGRVVTPAGAPLAGVTVDPGHGAPTAATDPNGVFLVLGLQNRPYDVEFRPAPGAPWAGALVPLVVSGATATGDVTLQPGFPISGVARNEAGAGLFGANVNVYAQNGARLFTPHDGTDPLGNFVVMVPAGTWDVRIVPPVATLLVPRQFEDLAVPPVQPLGTVTLATAHAVTGTVVDAASGVPVGATRIRATNALTGQRIVVINDTANTFGQFTLLLPWGVADLQFDPPAGNPHVGKQVFGAFVLGPTTLGQVRLTNGALLSGVVTGPGGPVAGADLDVLAADGSEIYSAYDFTDATGAFAVPVPPGGTYTLRIEPPAAAGLVGHRTAPLLVNGPTGLGTLALAAGIPVAGTITGPLGAEANADLDFVDGNGVELVTAGDHTDPNGHYATFVPAGTWRVEVTGAEGSHGRPADVPGVVIAGPTTWNHTLASKALVTAVTSYGIPTVPQGGPLPVNPFLHALSPGPLPTLLDLLVVLPSGQELAVFPTIAFDAPPFPLSLNGVWLPLPPVPAGATGRLLELVVRFRDPVTLALQDEASTPFVVQ